MRYISGGGGGGEKKSIMTRFILQVVEGTCVGNSCRHKREKKKKFGGVREKTKIVGKTSKRKKQGTKNQIKAKEGMRPNAASGSWQGVVGNVISRSSQ